jgi:hypothetical protein
VQPRYNLLYREIETELLPLCRARGLGVIPYNPLAGGFLSGKHAPSGDPTAGTRFTLGSAAEIYQRRYWQEAQFRAVERLKKGLTSRGSWPTTCGARTSRRCWTRAWICRSPRTWQVTTRRRRLEGTTEEESVRDTRLRLGWWCRTSDRLPRSSGAEQPRRPR